MLINDDILKLNKLYFLKITINQFFHIVKFFIIYKTKQITYISKIIHNEW